MQKNMRYAGFGKICDRIFAYNWHPYIICLFQIYVLICIYVLNIYLCCEGYMTVQWCADPQIFESASVRRFWPRIRCQCASATREILDRRLSASAL